MNRIRIKTPEQIEGCRRAGHVAADVLRIMCEATHAGMSTLELDEIARKTMEGMGATSADFGYYGYPGQTCISVNEACIHGVPKPDLIIQDGDVVSIDITVSFQGFIGDNARTIICGGRDKTTPDVLALVDKTEEALQAGIRAAVAGNRVGDISHAVEVVGNAAHLGILHEYVGHGCGIEMHEAPEIPNYGPAHRGPLLQPGMVICIEPMFTLGSRRIGVLDDDWTVVTRDGKPAAHSEQMLLITPNGAPAEILTPR